ncbi:hypothetical protein L6452_16378 [Arctium lappa]|uniref:Uncharacterized protein n=1 Tax=Arctium lappa TaxID=4217 RepID=A0ACB9C0N3_ARCLA|nr:hypothetical protein L6452_16378 [Arctium lappa]
MLKLPLPHNHDSVITNNHHAKPSSSASPPVDPPSCMAQPSIRRRIRMHHPHPSLPSNHPPPLPHHQHHTLFNHVTS